MPFKMIGTIILLVIFTIFVGFNLEDANRCNVWLFHTFEQVPVCITIMLSFLAGLVVMLPFSFGRRRQRKNSAPAKQKDVKVGMECETSPKHKGTAAPESKK